VLHSFPFLPYSEILSKNGGGDIIQRLSTSPVIKNLLKIRNKI